MRGPGQTDRTESPKVCIDAATDVVVRPPFDDDPVAVEPGESIGGVHTQGLAVAVAYQGRSARRGAKVETVQSTECHVSRSTSYR